MTEHVMTGVGMILAGDIGGTKAVLALYAPSSGGGVTLVRERAFPSASFPSLEAICDAFLTEGDAAAVDRACFGVPGAVVDGACRTTNLPWTISERALAEHLGARRVALLNDLQAAAYGMLFLEERELHVLQRGVGSGPLAERRSHIAVIAAGTGLGEGLLVWTGDGHLPIATEGGHATFAPRNALELELRDSIARSLGGGRAHVSWERVLSGPGLANIYAFLKTRGVHPESPRVAELLACGADVGAVVGAEAVRQSDPLCEEAVRLFVSLYGTEASNLALKILATGGVIVGGGIAPKLLPLLERGSFLESFLDKGRFAGLLANVPVLVALNDRTPVIGAAHWAMRLPR